MTVNSQTVDCHGCDCAVGESQTRGSDEGQTSPEKQLELAREMVLRRLERRAYSEAELRELLAKKGIAEEVVDELMAAFTRVGLVDDIAFAESLVETRHTFGHRSKMAVVLELRRKGISTEAIEQATEEIDRESDLEQARTVARLKTRSLAKLEHQVAYRRLAGALARKGFSPSIVAQVVRETLDLLESD
ncbi:MAG: recombination regulator RecX [Propionibacteriaceae bacterium]|nr:recombination regulator RecX [Propionibacteriaceae bacterium]